ncbi:hypothetical protein EWH12_19170 [Sphingobium cupriresistens]|uniref:Uncharacterized protein n=1 Tax=Sphingobium cupriresistens TaxID=1132417 RepID=A0A8G1ZIR2_9SPHN|nr:hypothetical protein EWH12_19170 [Sphingobium cupriresistens]
MPRSPHLVTLAACAAPARFDRWRSASANDRIGDQGQRKADERRDERHPRPCERHARAILP